MFLYSNPFLFWMRNWRDILNLPQGATELAERSLAFAMTPDQRGICQLVTKSVEFLFHVQSAALSYGEKKPGDAIMQLSPCRQIFEELEKIAEANHINSCGSLADIYRCRAAKKHVETVIHRIKMFGDGSLGYLPSFETITHPKFVPHDQGNWWLINNWANE